MHNEKHFNLTEDAVALWQRHVKTTDTGRDLLAPVKHGILDRIMHSDTDIKIDLRREDDETLRLVIEFNRGDGWRSDAMVSMDNGDTWIQATIVVSYEAVVSAIELLDQTLGYTDDIIDAHCATAQDHPDRPLYVPWFADDETRFANGHDAVSLRLPDLFGNDRPKTDN